MAKDLFVSTTGSDAVTYANNDINNPWLTVDKAIKGAEAAGDTIHFRTGTYDVTAAINQLGQGVDGTALLPVTYKPYNGESVTWTSNYGIGKTIFIENDYQYFEDITVVADGRFFMVADVSTTYFSKFSGCTLTLTTEGGGTNESVITFQALRANNGSVENCIFYGDSTWTNKNTAGVFIFQTEGITITNCEFYDFPSAIYYKHTGSGIDSGTAFTNNFFYATNAENPIGIDSCAQYATIENNLLVGCILKVNYGDGGTGGSGENRGGDYNTVDHNTVYDSDIRVTWGSENDASGATYNTLTNNITGGTVTVFKVEGIAYPHNSTLNYNLYVTGNAVNEYGTNYTLANWITHYSNDANSIAGTPIFVNGSGNLNEILDFALTPESDGYGVGTGGTNIGADVLTIGSDITPPATGTGQPVSIGTGEVISLTAGETATVY